MESKILIVGGSWDLNGGRESGFIKKFYFLVDNEEAVMYYNDISNHY